jgi:hypothetical protein
MHETFASCGWYCPAAHAVHAVTSPPAETYLPRGYSEYSQRVLGVLTKGTHTGAYMGNSEHSQRGLARAAGPADPKAEMRSLRAHLSISVCVCVCVCVCVRVCLRVRARTDAFWRECVSVPAGQCRGTRSTHARVAERYSEYSRRGSRAVLGVLTPGYPRGYSEHSRRGTRGGTWSTHPAAHGAHGAASPGADVAWRWPGLQSGSTQSPPSVQPPRALHLRVPREYSESRVSTPSPPRGPSASTPSTPLRCLMSAPWTPTA